MQSCSSLDSIDAFQNHSHTHTAQTTRQLNPQCLLQTPRNEWQKNEEFFPGDESIHDRIQSIHRPLILIRRTQVQISH